MMGSRPRTRRKMEAGRVIEYRNSYYFVPDEVADAHLRRGDDLEHEPHNGDPVDLPKFGSQKQAECWARIQEISPSYTDYSVEYPPPSEKAHRAREDDVPVVVALEGKAKIAAYLFAINHSKLGISHALDVSERTVGQYISDVRRGER